MVNGILDFEGHSIELAATLKVVISTNITVIFINSVSIYENQVFVRITPNEHFKKVFSCDMTFSQYGYFGFIFNGKSSVIFQSSGQVPYE